MSTSPGDDRRSSGGFRPSAASELADARSARALLDELPVVVAEISPVGTILWVNRCAASTLGLAREEVLGLDIRDLGRDKARARQVLSRLASADLRGVDLEFVGTDGRPRVLSCSTANRHAPDGSLSRIVAYAVDVTGQRRAEAARTSAERFSRDVLDSLDQHIAVLDPGGRIVLVNRRWTEFAVENGGSGSSLGPGADYLGTCRSSRGAFSEGASETADGIEAVLGGRRDFFRAEYACPSAGTPRRFEMKVLPAEIGRRRHAIVLHQDVTARWQAERDLRLGEESLQRRVRRLEALRDVEGALSSSLDLGRTLGVLASRARSSLGVDASAVLLRGEDGALSFAAGEGFRTEALRHTHLGPGQGLAGRAVESGDVVVARLGPGTTILASSPGLACESFVSYAGAPMIVRDRVVGVLELFSRLPLEADREWLDFLRTLASGAAVAVENASLYEKARSANADLRATWDATLEGWARAVDLRDGETEGHSQRVAAWTASLALARGLPQEEVEHLRRAAQLHDIGKIGIPDAILRKPGPLTPEERVVMQTHPVLGDGLLAPLSHLVRAREVTRWHHERWDGTGYPDRLAGEEIPLAARLFAVVDVWDALTTDRPYRDAWTREKARDFLAAGAGTQFDPEVVETFLRLLVDPS